MGRSATPQTATRATEASETNEIVTVNNGCERFERIFGFEPEEDFVLVIFGWVAEFESDEEPVQLGFGQRESALEFHGVLRCYHKERGRQRHGHAFHGQLALFHCLQERCLRARRGAV